MNPQFAVALDAANDMRGRGYNPVPSRMDRKGPLLETYTEYWDAPVPDSVFRVDAWRTSNMQMMTGTRWRLAVVDCDGDEAHVMFRMMKGHHGDTGPYPTWVARTGGGGWHYYFTLPAYLDECPSRRVWGIHDAWAGTNFEKPGSAIKGDWQGHKEVRILADRGLAVAPPSIHVTSKNPYYWVAGRSPADYARPMPIPPWILDLPGIVAPAPVVPAAPRLKAERKAPSGPPGAFYDRDDVLAAIPDKIALVRSWGVRIASQRANAKGWWSAYAIDRDERTPSASVHEENGVYYEQRDQVKMGLFDLGVKMGAYLDWQEAIRELGNQYLARRAA